jgi:hypothetical protein
MAKQIASSNAKPGAWIVSPKDRGRKQIKSGKVFLKDGDEFEVELFNPLTVSVLADIKLNGQSISKTGLVVKPGQRVYLDCFIDDRKKFKFSTYEIENSGEALDATQNNGVLEVFFYKEDVITLDNWQRKFDRVIVEKYYPYNPYPWYGPNRVYCGSGKITYGGTTLTTNGNSFTMDASNGLIGGTTNVYNSSNNINCSYSSQVDLSNLNVAGSLSTNSIETGRVEKGEESKQKFTEVDMDFENHYIASTIIQILPESRKPTEVKNVKINIELPNGDWTKKQIEEAKEVVQNFLWKENTEETQKEMNNTIELIKKLGELHSAGILTDEEFSTKKAELLSKI